MVDQRQYDRDRRYPAQERQGAGRVEQRRGYRVAGLDAADAEYRAEHDEDRQLDPELT